MTRAATQGRSDRRDTYAMHMIADGHARDAIRATISTPSASRGRMSRSRRGRSDRAAGRRADSSTADSWCIPGIKLLLRALGATRSAGAVARASCRWKRNYPALGALDAARRSAAGLRAHLSAALARRARPDARRLRAGRMRSATPHDVRIHSSPSISDRLVDVMSELQDSRRISRAASSSSASAASARACCR